MEIRGEVANRKEMTFKMNLPRAIHTAVLAHQYQKDKQGELYILHPLRVMLALTGNDEDMILGVLHDVLEDTNWTIKKLEQDGFGPALLADLICLTRDKTHETYSQYIEKVSTSPRAVRVKIADLRDNLRGSPDDYPELKLRYRQAFARLGAQE